MTARAGLLMILAVALLSPGCNRKKSDGTCKIDIDCEPGWNCKQGVCVKRPRPSWETQSATPAPRIEERGQPPRAGAPTAPEQPPPAAAPSAPVPRSPTPESKPATAAPSQMEPAKRGYFPPDT